MPRAAVAFERHHHKSKAEQNTHRRADAEIAEGFAVGNQHTQARNQSVMAVQLPPVSFSDKVVVAFQAVVQAEIQVFANGGKTWQKP